MKWTGERVVPWNAEIHPQVMHAHIIRYAWATRLVAGYLVCDLGCGAGYGAFLLSWIAREVLAVDVSEEAIAFAKQRFISANLTFGVMDIQYDALPDADVYVAFEVLEHLDDPQAVLERIGAKPIVWSIPVQNRNPWHKHAYSVAEIQALMPGVRGYQFPNGNITGTIPPNAPSGYVLGFYDPGGGN